MANNDIESSFRAFLEKATAEYNSILETIAKSGDFGHGITIEIGRKTDPKVYLNTIPFLTIKEFYQIKGPK